MVKTVVVRPLSVADVEDYRAIRLSALKTAPEAFGSVHAEEASKSIEEHGQRLASSLVMGAYEGEQIVGMIGFKREEGPKDNHKGFVWGFYVEPDRRDIGVGSALMSALLGAVRDPVEQVTLCVVEENIAALALYERFGFVRYGLEPRALKSAAGYSNEVQMVLFLDVPRRVSAGEASSRQDRRRGR